MVENVSITIQKKASFYISFVIAEDGIISYLESQMEEKSLIDTNK